MADQLSLRINLSSAQAADKLRAFNALLGAGDKSMASFNKALKGMATASNVSTSDLKKTSSEVDKLGQKSKGAASAMTALNKGAGAFGSSFTRSIKGAISGTWQLTKGILAVGAAMAGIGGVKLLSDYIDYSKSAGQLNAIVKGNGSTARYLENMGVKATAGTGQSASDVMNSMQNVASTLEFDPTRGKALPGGGYEVLKAGSAEYMANLKQIGDLTQRNAEFSSSMNTGIGTMTDAMIKYAGVFGYNMKDMNDVIKIQDKFNALLNTSQGGLERLVPQISKFGQQFKNLGLSEDEALSVFSTLTNVFDPEEAGTRTLAVGNWIQNSSQKIGPMMEKMGTVVGKQFQDALYNPDGSRKRMKDQIMGVMAMMDQLPTDYQKDIFGGLTFSEIRQASGIRSMSSLMDKYDATVKEIANDTGLSSKSIDAYWAASGAKLDLVFKSMQAGAMSGVGAVIDIFSSLSDPSKFDVKSFTDGIGELGAKLNYRLGDGASAPLAALRDSILWLNDNRQIITHFADTMVKLAKAVGAVGKFALDIVLSPPVQAFLDWAISNPEIAIITAFSAVAIKDALTGALVGAFGAGPVGVAIAAAILTGLVAYKNQQDAQGILDKAQKDNKDVFSNREGVLAFGAKSFNPDSQIGQVYSAEQRAITLQKQISDYQLDIAKSKNWDIDASKRVQDRMRSGVTVDGLQKELADTKKSLRSLSDGMTEAERTMKAQMEERYDKYIPEPVAGVQKYNAAYSAIGKPQAGPTSPRQQVLSSTIQAVANPGAAVMGNLPSIIGGLAATLANPSAIFGNMQGAIGEISGAAAKAISDVGAAIANINSPNVSVPVNITNIGQITSTVSRGPTTNSAGNKAGGWVQGVAAAAMKQITGK